MTTITTVTTPQAPSPATQFLTHTLSCSSTLTLSTTFLTRHITNNQELIILVDIGHLATQLDLVEMEIIGKTRDRHVSTLLTTPHNPLSPEIRSRNIDIPYERGIPRISPSDARDL